MSFDWMIIGAGFTGATLAERLATQLGQRVLIVEKRDHIGGNAYDYHNEHNILVHKYGPHIFHTNSEQVWQYLSNFTQWRPYFHQVLGVVDGKSVPIPFNLNSLHALFPSQYAQKLESLLVEQFGLGAKVPILRLREHSAPELQLLAQYIYSNVFLKYTLKQWGLKPEELDTSVTGRVPVFISRDDRYFQDRYQALPLHGYTQMFRRMLQHPNIKVMLNTDYREMTSLIPYHRMIYTGPIDSFFEYRYGELPYRSLRFDFQTLDHEWHQEVGTVNYPNEYDFTRITEQKYLTGQSGPKTTLVTEYPEPHVPGVNDPYYPIPRPENRELYDRYAADAKALDGRVLFAGRLADYKYYNMDQACARALNLFKAIARDVVETH